MHTSDKPINKKYIIVLESVVCLQKCNWKCNDLVNKNQLTHASTQKITQINTIMTFWKVVEFSTNFLKPLYTNLKVKFSHLGEKHLNMFCYNINICGAF